jgi:hypothetical protein
MIALIGCLVSVGVTKCRGLYSGIRVTYYFIGLGRITSFLFALQGSRRLKINI